MVKNGTSFLFSPIRILGQGKCAFFFPILSLSSLLHPIRILTPREVQILSPILKKKNPNAFSLHHHCHFTFPQQLVSRFSTPRCPPLFKPPSPLWHFPSLKPPSLSIWYGFISDFGFCFFLFPPSTSAALLTRTLDAHRRSDLHNHRSASLPSPSVSGSILVWM